MNKNESLIFKVLKVVIIISMIIIIGITGFYFYEILGEKEPSYFSVHFALPIIFMVVGILAILLPMANKEKLTTNDKGDKMMPVIGVILILVAIISCIFSFINK